MILSDRINHFGTGWLASQAPKFRKQLLPLT
jgi:hypothetical protein